ncbi:hypothetical protein EHEL_090630 [Encephalitozoon hellem ATCC 50504]|uniref:Protein ARV n=1 Tax=Encephalitozoon hellem TaxID=27973 RepID=A0A9Q9FA85_ENCHE|nr:uncharacterized protein EHEL_090630 [Encephalitozoon hellem ATCC 50504]AFM98958.1 hypothetical protein EHEL_090630 [Encephalitozoon hellem ATCC 50504]UTX43972.1 Arv1-like protein [Encephalitozoon hellem]WEL39457.1 Arv1-like protein [Encephalitozoon hellem]|eukprot:XP_003887939.1 hypothetical protein EHEL_090630 [Encephalitozoon hellem ATCC 50504]
MYVCIECGCRAKQLFLKNSSAKQISKCLVCCKKMDRYFELNGLMKLIDLLLLKRRIFRHYLFNNKKDFTGGALLMLVVRVLTGPMLRHHDALRLLLSGEGLGKAVSVDAISIVFRDAVESLMETGLLLVLSFTVFHRRAGFIKLSSALLLSSFYYLFVFIMIMWRYQWEEYLPVIDFLCIASNSIVVSEMCLVRNETAAGCLYGCKIATGLLCKRILGSIGL